MQKTHTLNTLTVRIVAHVKASTRWLAPMILHGTSPQGEQSTATAVAEVKWKGIQENLSKSGQKSCNKKG